MKYNLKSTTNFQLLLFFSVLGYLFMPTAIAISVAEDKNPDINTTVLFQPPPESEQPENTDSAASRHNRLCFQDFVTAQDQKAIAANQNIIPIVPEENYGLTLTERPTFWVYLPQTSAQKVILSLKEDGLKSHWQQSIDITQKVGIIGIKLSEEAPILEVGKNYQWAVILLCGNRPNPNDPVVTSWIKRIENSQISSSSQTELEKAANYAQQGIWYDTLDILIAAKESAVDNWQNIWIEYLRSGGLDTIVNEPIVDK